MGGGVWEGVKTVNSSSIGYTSATVGRGEKWWELVYRHMQGAHISPPKHISCSGRYFRGDTNLLWRLLPRLAGEYLCQSLGIAYIPCIKLKVIIKIIELY